MEVKYCHRKTSLSHVDHKPQCLYVQEHTEQIISLVRGKDGVALGCSNELMHKFTRQLYV